MGEIFKRSLEQIKRNKQRRLQGLVNNIPFGFPRFEEFVPGLQRKNYTIVTASSGVGKSKLTKYLYVISVINFILANPQMGIKLKIFYFCLEESKEAFIQSIKCYKLFELYGKIVDIKNLRSNTGILDDETEAQIEALDPWFDVFEETVEIIDYIRKPYAIYKHVEEYLENPEVGAWTYKEVPVTRKAADGSTFVESQRVRNFYNYVNQDTYVEVITDHIGLLEPEKGMDGVWDAIGKYSSTYSVALRDRYYCSVINVQQQVAEQEKKQYTYKGNSIESKLEPSLDGLGDNKTTQRDADEVIGLFAPTRYEIDEHRGYNIATFQDNYRSLSVLKARDGVPNIRLGLFFNGAVNFFEELPKKDEMNPERYNYYLLKAGRSALPPQRQQQPGGERTYNFS